MLLLELLLLPFPPVDPRARLLEDELLKASFLWSTADGGELLLLEEGDGPDDDALVEGVLVDDDDEAEEDEADCLMSPVAFSVAFLTSVVTPPLFRCCLRVISRGTFISDTVRLSLVLSRSFILDA